MFIDETGFFMHPVVRRTWAPRGQTPVLRHRTRHHRKVSAIGGLSISPRRFRLGWYLRLHAHTSIGQEQVIGFLQHLLRHLRGRVIVVWDNLSAHRGKRLRQWLRRRRRLHLEYLPAYAPELNPVEYGWSDLKSHRLANYCPQDVQQLHAAARRASKRVRGRQPLLRSFVKASTLPIRLK